MKSFALTPKKIIFTAIQAFKNHLQEALEHPLFKKSTKILANGHPIGKYEPEGPIHLPQGYPGNPRTPEIPNMPRTLTGNTGKKYQADPGITHI